MTAERSKRWQNLGIIVVTAVIALIMIWANTYQRMREEYIQGEELFAQGEYLKAVTAYETAIHAYVPWSGKIRRSAERLWEIGNLYEEQGEVELALIAYRSLRSSFYAVRSFYQPYPEWIQRTSPKIQALMGEQERLLQAPSRKVMAAPREPVGPEAPASNEP